ncbi:hypothetical protein BH18ACT2_BH18ACT2_24530 [soil metagenome]
MPRRVALALTAVTCSFAAAACGSDDDESSATTAGTTATTAGGAAPTSTVPETTTEVTAETTTAETTETTIGESAGGDVDAFCQAEVAAEAAAQSEDLSEAGPAFEALDAAPDEIKPTVEEVVANAESGPGDPAFDEPYGEMIAFMQDNCGFTDLEVEGADYSFTGLPPEVEAGPAIITFTNVGEEVHEISMARINDGVTETVAELLELPEEEVFSKITPVGRGFGLPGTMSYAVVDLSEPGNYVATCFIPKGLTPEVMAQMEEMAPEGTSPEGTDGSPPAGSDPMAELGPPHALLGMVQEFTVT